MLNTAKLARIHYSSRQSTTDCITQTLLTEILNTTKFIEVTFHTDTDTGSSEKDSERTTVSIGTKQQPEEGLSEQKNLESEVQTIDFNRKLNSQEKKKTE